MGLKRGHSKKTKAAARKKAAPKTKTALKSKANAGANPNGLKKPAANVGLQAAPRNAPTRRQPARNVGGYQRGRLLDAEPDAEPNADVEEAEEDAEGQEQNEPEPLAEAEILGEPPVARDAARSKKRRSPTASPPANAVDADDDDGEEEGGEVRNATRRHSKRRKLISTDVEEDDEQPQSVKQQKTISADEAIQNGLFDVEVLAEVQNDTGCTFQDADAMLRVNLQVHRDPNGFRSRLGYQARLTLIRDGADPEAIGYIRSWRVDKPTARFPNGRERPWMVEILRRPHAEANGHIGETILALQALYNDDGSVKDHAQTNESELADESLLFLEMIYIHDDFQGQGLSRHAFPAFHHLLALLPEWYAFSGSIVLIPARPDDYKGNKWGRKQSRTVENALIEIYRKVGGYEIWAANVLVDRNIITVMGRRVP